MLFDTLVDVCNDAVFYQNALAKYKGETGQIFCDICNKCPISRSYGTNDNDLCVKCYNRLVRNMNFWKTHLRKGKKELDEVIMECIEQQCDMTTMDVNGMLKLFDSNHNCTQNPKMSRLTCKYCLAVNNYNAKMESTKDIKAHNCTMSSGYCSVCSKGKKQPDNYRPRYTESHDTMPSLGESTRMAVDKDDDMKDEDEDEEMADYKEHANTRRARFVPDDSY